MTRSPIIVRPESYHTAMDVIATKVTVLAAKQDTLGQEFTFQSGKEGMGPPPHSHAWDEAFFVIKGSVNITCGGNTELCPAGTLAFVPGGTIHSFKYGPDGGEMLEITAAGGSAVQMFTELSEEIQFFPPDIDKVVEVMGRNGATVHR